MGDDRDVGGGTALTLTEGSGVAKTPPGSSELVYTYTYSEKMTQVVKLECMITEKKADRGAARDARCASLCAAPCAVCPLCDCAVSCGAPLDLSNPSSVENIRAPNARVRRQGRSRSFSADDAHHESMILAIRSEACTARMAAFILRFACMAFISGSSVGSAVLGSDLAPSASHG